jgi:hypothetical protein
LIANRCGHIDHRHWNRRSTHNVAAPQQRETGDIVMTARFADLLDRTALTVFLSLAAVTVFAFPLVAVVGIH